MNRNDGLLARHCHPGGGGGGYSVKFVRGGSARRFKPLPFYILIFTENGTPFIYLEQNCTLSYTSRKTIEFPVIARFSRVFGRSDSVA